MDKFDAEKYATVYSLLADILERERLMEDERVMSYALGDLARRLFVGTKFDPPDEVLEEVAHAIRSGDGVERTRLAVRLRDHAEHLTGWDH